MQRRIPAVLLCLGLLATLTWWWWRGAPPTPPNAQATPRAFTLRAVLALPAPSSAGRMSGAVRSSEGRPIAEANVCATCAGCNPAETTRQRCANTDARGNFALEALEVGSYRVTASAQGFVPGVAAHGAPVLISEATPSVSLELTLEHGGAEVSGHVLDATGGPVAGVELRLVDWQSPPSVTDATTDNEGRFKTWVKRGRVSIHALADGYSPSGLERIAPARDIEIVITPGGSISGQVILSGDERAVSGATVSAELLGETRNFQRSGVSNLRGEFSLHGLEPGLYALHASGPGYEGRLAEPVGLAGVGHHVEGILIAVSRAAQVSGKVLIEPAGSACTEGSVVLGPPMPDVLLSAHSPAAQAQPPTTQSEVESSVLAAIGPDGSVRFPAVRPGRYAASVNCRDHTWRSGPARVEVSTHDLDGLVWGVGKGLGLELQVVDEQGRPVAATTPMLQFPASAGQSGMLMPLPTDHEGRHRYPTELYPGRYEIHAERGQRADPLSVELQDGMGTAKVVLRVKGQGAISVQVKTREGASVDGLTVSAYPFDQDHPAGIDHRGLSVRGAALLRVGGAVAATPQGAGVYRAGPLEPGKYRIEILDDVNPAQLANATDGGDVIDVRSGVETTLEVELHRSSAVRGRIVDAAGEPVADAWVYLEADEPAAAGGVSSAGLPRPRRLSDTDGRFAFTDLAPGGTFTLSAETMDGAGTVRKPGLHAPADVQLRLRAPGAVHGTLQLADGKPADSFSVVYRDFDSGATRTAFFGKTQGRFTLERVAPGRLELFGATAMGESTHVEVSLNPGQTLSGVALRLPLPGLGAASSTANAPLAAPPRAL